MVVGSPVFMELKRKDGGSAYINVTLVQSMEIKPADGISGENVLYITTLHDRVLPYGEVTHDINDFVARYSATLSGASVIATPV